MDAATFARKIRSGEPAVGYWVVSDSPVATERLAHLDFDFVCLDAQHGLIGHSGIVAGLMAVTAGGRAAGVVRVEANDPTPIGRALDAGAASVIVPFVDTAAHAAAAGFVTGTHLLTDGGVIAALRAGRWQLQM